MEDSSRLEYSCFEEPPSKQNMHPPLYVLCQNQQPVPTGFFNLKTNDMLDLGGPNGAS